MNNLKKRLLSSIELHGKCDIHGLLQIYPEFNLFTILRNLFILQNEGWIKVRKTRTIDGITTKNPNVARTNKQMYSQTHFDWLGQ